MLKYFFIVLALVLYFSTNTEANLGLFNSIRRHEEERTRRLGSYSQFDHLIIQNCMKECHGDNCKSECESKINSPRRMSGYNELMKRQDCNDKCESSTDKYCVGHCMYDNQA